MHVDLGALDDCSNVHANRRQYSRIVIIISHTTPPVAPALCAVYVCGCIDQHVSVCVLYYFFNMINLNEFSATAQINDCAIEINIYTSMEYYLPRLNLFMCV